MYTIAKTQTGNETFTITHAKYLAGKVAADMRGFRNSYGVPAEAHIDVYASEIAYLLKDGFLSVFEFGLQKNHERVVSYRYEVVQGQLVAANDRPGKIESEAETSGASFFNCVSYSSKWHSLTDQEKTDYYEGSPLQRDTVDPYKDGDGHWNVEQNYSASTTSLQRKSFIPNKRT